MRSEQLERALVNLALALRDAPGREPGHAEALAGLVLGAQHHVFQHAHARQHARRLKRAHQPGARYGIAARAGDVATGEAHRAAVGPDEPRHEIEHRRLAGAVRDRSAR